MKYIYIRVKKLNSNHLFSKLLPDCILLVASNLTSKIILESIKLHSIYFSSYFNVSKKNPELKISNSQSGINFLLNGKTKTNKKKTHFTLFCNAVMDTFTYIHRASSDDKGSKVIKLKM